MKSFLPIVALLSLGLVLAEENQSFDLVFEAISSLQNDGFDETVIPPLDRKKRSTGGYGGSYVGNYLPVSHLGFGGNNGYYGNGYHNQKDNRPNVNFVQSFRPGKVVVEKNHIVHNYYKQGNYQKALQYFYAIPLIKVAKAQNGYVGHYQKKRSYTVSVCKGCNQGHPQIEVRCNTKPYSYLVRRFNFMPQINNVNYNTYNKYSVEHPKHQPVYQSHPTYYQAHPVYQQEHPTYQLEHPTYQQEHPTYQLEHPTYQLEHPNYQQKHPTYQQGHPGYGTVVYASAPQRYGYQDNNNYVNQANFGPRDGQH